MSSLTTKLIPRILIFYWRILWEFIVKLWRFYDKIWFNCGAEQHQHVALCVCCVCCVQNRVTSRVVVQCSYTIPFLVGHLSVWQKYHKAEYVQRCVCFVNVQSSLPENVVFSVCARMCNATYIIFIMWNSISCLDACYHFRLNISCGVAVTVRSHQKKYQVTF